jgi:N,N'-diacetylchitobiose phosphorylase
MKYGYFDNDNSEYVIIRPDTPRPWSNYLGSSEFGAVITNNAAGYTFYKSAAQGRLSRFRFNGPPSDMPGKYIYLRDTKSGEFWSNAWQPVGKPLDKFSSECRHGTGYTTITSIYSGIQCKVQYFSPMGRLEEVWKITLTNISDVKRNISAFPYIEPQCNWNATDDAHNLQYTQYIIKTNIVNGIIDIANNINMPEDQEHFEKQDQARHLFFALAGVEATGYDTDMAKFLGVYGSYAVPEAVKAGACTNSGCAGDMPCGAFQIDVELAPGESRDFAVIYGVGFAASAGIAARERYEKAGSLDAELKKIKAHWAERLGVLAVETPDDGFNAMVNLWAPYNNLMTFYWSRTASLVYAGERDGLGFRDTVQDIVGATALVTDESRERLELMLTGQCSTGGALAVVKPFAHNPGHEPLPEDYRSDDCLWFFNAVPAFIKETGDIGFYSKVLPYADTGTATVFGHLRRALEFNLERCGAHGIPCGLDADWNDCIRLGEQGESLFVAFQLRLGLREYIDIAKRLNETKEAVWGETQLAQFDAILEKYAWDGNWYLRAYRYDGLKFGANECEEGKIFMNPQSWSVLSGHAQGERATKAMTAMHEQLATDYGIMVCTPPYITTDPKVCLGRLMNPGMKENGGVFNHTQGWAVMAAAEMGMNERAWEYMHNVMPASFNDRAEIREVEPYVVCQSTHSRFSPRYGAGRISWLSGAAVWNYVAMTTAILGIQPDYDGLRIKPCLPEAWPAVKVRRTFRDRQFDIKITNGGPGSSVKELIVNGTRIEGNLIPIEICRKENSVTVVMEPRAQQ